MPLWALSFEVRHRPAVAELVEPYGIQDGVDVGKIDTSDNWRQRRRLRLNTARVYQRLNELTAGAKANPLSLAVVKPTRVVDCVMEPDESPLPT